MWEILLLVAALLCFLLAAFGVRGRIDLVALGLALCVAAALIPHIT
jgi:hypothetical protein